MQHIILQSSLIDTPLGQMIAIADENTLHLIQFTDHRCLQRDIKRLQAQTKSTIISGITEPIKSIEHELQAYFAGKLQKFQTPLCLRGTAFQQSVWLALQQIPFAATQSYANLAATIGKPTAFRAVALANAANQFVIAIPCHRVINKNGDLGGYSCGLSRKALLLQHEKTIVS